MLKACGCSPVIAVDVDPARLERAGRLGADVVINAGQRNVAEEVRKHVPRGTEVAVEAVGIAAALRDAVASLRKGGRLALIGNLSPTVDLVTREISVNGSCASRGEYPTCLELISRGAVDVDALISATAPLADGAEWFQRLYRGESGLMKVVLLPQEGE